MALPSIKTLDPINGRQLKEDNTYVNIANLIEELHAALVTNKNAGVEVASFDTGVATGGGNTTIVDTAKDFEVNMLAGTVVSVEAGGKTHLRSVLSNTTDTITINPLPGAAASVILGNPGFAEVTVTCVAMGIGGNEYTAEIVDAPGDDDNLSASLTGLVLTVYLGKTGGVLDGAKNTATLVAAAIDAVPEFTAAMTGIGGVMAVMEEPVPFTGGVAIVDVSAGSKYEIKKRIVVSDGGGSVTVDGAVSATLTGSTIDLRGLVANKPAANSVAIGVTYWSVDTGAVEVSDGTSWVVV